ncbi:MAG: DUF5686 and carboxypeptidase regulatory-like domain-containing protein [Bacteroidota bacterium]|nr:DUF5686 and carboxypeptidase regulatory-like domain-containing protein [Bacteroidota bacterium]
MRGRSHLLFALLLFPFITNQAQVLRGRITDTGGAPMPAASVYISELRQGTTSNSDGWYEISLPAGSYTVNYQFLGYLPVTRRFNLADDDITADITLTEQLFEIPPVRVSASGKDPAYFIMRKAIGMAPFHLRQVKMWQAEVYIRGGGSVDKIPEMLKRRMKIESNGGDLKEGRYYFSESVNMITFNAPDRYVHRVISSNSSEDLTQGQASPMDFIEASFYQPVLVEMAISPLAPNAFSHYIFTFMGSSSQGNYVIDKISVTPRRKSQQLFTGVIYIVEDLWAIHSLDLTNDNMAGRIRVRQLYTPVKEGIWMPVSHEFNADISIMGVKARAAYTSAVKYTEVEPDRSIRRSPAYETADAAGAVEVPDERPKSAAEREIEALLAKDDLTARDMSRLARLNEKNARTTRVKPSLEIEDKTTVIVEDNATGRDSAYWAEVRPIPLTREESASLATAPAAKGKLAVRDTSTLSITIGAGSSKDPKSAADSSGNKKSPATRFIRDLTGGRNWQLSKNTFLEFDGLADLKSFSFNSVDGFVAGTGMNLSVKSGKAGRFTLAPSARYAFSRKRLMWNVTANMLYDPMHSGNIFIRAGSQSDEFSPSGVNQLVNTASSLFFRDNMMRLYESRYIIAGHRSDIANGLTLSVSGMYEKRDTLANNSSFSFFRKDRPWSVNIPDNPYAVGDTEGYDYEPPVTHEHLSFTTSLTWTPRQRYRIANGARIPADSDYPTFTLSWRHGYNHNNSFSGSYDLVSGEISRVSRYGALNEFRWRVRAGGFLNSENVRLQDMYYFNTQSSPVLLNFYEDAFYLKPCYSVSTKKAYAEAHVRYTTPTLLLKRLPVLSRTLMRENIGISALWTPEAGYYYETGYSLSEVLLVGTVGVYAGFTGTSFESAGIRVILRID